jgi:hypothetical protein
MKGVPFYDHGDYVIVTKVNRSLKDDATTSDDKVSANKCQ